MVAGESEGEGAGRSPTAAPEVGEGEGEGWVAAGLGRRGGRCKTMSLKYAKQAEQSMCGHLLQGHRFPSEQRS